MNIKNLSGYNTAVLPYHLAQSLVAGIRYGFPGKKLRVIGVTGTNGKTTTCFMLWKMLNVAGHKTGLLTTVGWGVPGLTAEKLKQLGVKTDTPPDRDGLIKQIEHMTTADSFTLNRRIKIIQDEGAEFLILETTSHALSQFRTLGIPIEIAVMTNVTHEHLDYHKTFDRYVAAKAKLFKKAKYGVINRDDPSYRVFKKAINGRSSKENYAFYGIKNPADFRATSINLSASGVEYTCGDIKIKTQIPGEFNIYNSLAALAVGKKLGLPDDKISIGIHALKEVEGRMNRLDLGQKFEVIVDFAHTPDAFEKVFTSVKAPSKTGHIISLFGGAGQRDKTTRKERGEIAGKYSDICILTEDDPRDESPAEIAEMFKIGCKKAGMKDDQIIIELDRKAAIERAINLAKPGDLVLVLGKGHEKTILRADGPHPFEDLKVTAAALKNLKTS
ncbi:UDP-N-acetylmuramoyl-L-alanyl-D-glutamate--2,6-diaminopimelate ligase [Candidatus Saccharibacteria bacterium]|nr:UDP-N-acetylmuramoyl-L-alanyl-D-glutamate--2,6-diaminopimelate ligase [Candidatus Saccharibacteria bacterium]